MRPSVGFVAILSLSMVTVSDFAAAEPPIVIKFSHVVAVDTPKGRAAEYFKKLAEERTHGRVRVQVYPNSTLYRDKEEMEAVQLGAVQMLAPSLAKFGVLGIREFEVFDLPYLFDSYADLHKITQGPVGQALLEKLEGRGVVGLSYWDNGFKVMSANRPLRMPDDFKGLKMRIQPSKVLEQQMRDLGATPQVTPLSEVYQALQTGLVNGTENPPSNLYTQKIYEVQKFVTVSNHGYLGYAVIANKRFWDALPDDIRATLESALRDATQYANEIAMKENDDDLELVRKSGRTQIISLTPDEKRAWKKVLLDVHRQQASRIGKATLEAIYRATGFDADKQ